MRTLFAAALAATLALSPFALGPAHAAETAAQGVPYWHLYSDAKGVSHFKKETLPFKPMGAPGAADGPMGASLNGVTAANFLMLKAGQVEDWHRAPNTLFLVVVQGASEVTASDGTVKDFHRGDVVLMDDTSGKGHITKAIGKVNHIALMIPVTK
jgi:hypothetical protein